MAQLTFGEWLLLIIVILLTIATVTTLIVAFLGGDITKIFSGAVFVPFSTGGSSSGHTTGPGGTGTIPVSFLTDPFNCGGTGIVCDFTLGQDCSGGVCRCPTGQSLCTGIGCVDLSGTTFACGSCANPCTGGNLCCAGVCTPFLDNINSCGACGRVCTGIMPACCAGNCRDLATSNSSCGSCFNPCAAGLQCCGGVCKNLQSDSQNCNACGNVCPPNTICSNGSCVPGCPTGLILCGGVCTDPYTDTFNCNGCGQVCPPGTYCNGGNCFPNVCTVTGTVFCPDFGLCQQTLSSTNNCGSCGTVCPLFCIGGACTCQTNNDCPHNQSCVNNFCQEPACPPGTVFCGYIGQCVNQFTSSTDCGQCGRTCATGFTCVGGSCTCAEDSNCPLGQICIAGTCVFN